jgi:hypothetical protein
MTMRRVLTLTVLLLGFSAAARADILATGAMFGGNTQNGVVCYLFNAGTGPVTVVSNQIIKEPNISLPLVSDTCGVLLAAGNTCGIAANIVNNAAHSCKFVVSPSGADVRGVMEVRSGLTVLQNSNLR